MSFLFLSGGERMKKEECVKMLMVDDSLLALKMAQSIIEQCEGLEIETEFATCGEEAIRKAQTKEFGVIVLDVVMPNMDGRQVLRELGNLGLLEEIKVIMLSALADEDMLKECFELGASDYTTKPIKEVEFISRIRSAIREYKLIRKIKYSNKALKYTRAQMLQQEKLAGIGTLAAGIAHEINNPLGYIVSNFNVLKDYMKSYSRLLECCVDIKEYNLNLATVYREEDFEYIEEDVGALLKETSSGLDRVKKIIVGLRNFSRIDTEGELEKYDLNDGIKTTLIIANNEIKYIADLEMDLGEIPSIQANGGEINQVILNLLLNGAFAIKESNGKERGKIEIKTFVESQWVCFTIKDNGTGIAKGVVERIFEPFFTTKAVGKGTGLGLSVSYDIIKNKHCGDISVISELGKGSEFKIKLPHKMNIECE